MNAPIPDGYAGLVFPWEDAPSEGAVIEIAKGVLWARLPLPMALDHVNIYFLREGDGWAMVDTGMDTKRTRAMIEDLRAGPLGGLPITRLLVTHHHPDHVGLAGWLQAQGTELLISRVSWLLARMLVLDEQDRPAPETMAFCHAYGMAPEVLEQRAEERPFNFADCVAPLPLGYTRLQEGQRLSLGGREWDIVFGGGHAPDHVVLFERGGDLVLGGDQLLPGISPNIGLYPTEPDGDPVGDWLEACDRIAPFVRPDQLVLPGHKLPYRNLPVRLASLRLNQVHALDRLEAHLDQPRIGHDCFAPLFKREIGSGIYGLAFAETAAHLNHLYLTGRATRRDRGDGVWLWERAGLGKRGSAS